MAFFVVSVVKKKRGFFMAFLLHSRSGALVLPPPWSLKTTRRWNSNIANIEDGVERSLRRDARVPPGATLVALVSGGSDSVALLVALSAVRRRWRPALRLNVLHFEHGLRGDASLEDANFVRALARRHDVPCRVETWNQTKPPSQVASRNWRRRVALEAVAEAEAEASAFALTAHHADDQTETALLRLARGSRLSRVFAGMVPYAPPFAKPLLAFSKDELRDYLRAKNESWREDASNAEAKYARNKVRLQVVPPLAELGDLRVRVAALARQSAALDEWLSDAADGEEKKRLNRHSSLDVDGWAAVPEPVRHELLARLLARAGGSTPSFANLVDLDDDLLGAGTVRWDKHLPGNVLVRRRADGLDARQASSSSSSSSSVLLAPMDDDFFGGASQVLRLGRRRVVVEGGRGRPPPRRDGATTVRFSAPPPPLELRTRRDGDRFHPPWRRRAIKLKDFLRGQRVSTLARDDVLLLAKADADLVLAVLIDPPCVAKDFGVSEDDEHCCGDDALFWLSVVVASDDDDDDGAVVPTATLSPPSHD